MDGERKVWAPDVREGFCLGKITDIGSETISVELLDNGKVGGLQFSLELSFHNFVFNMYVNKA